MKNRYWVYLVLVIVLTPVFVCMAYNDRGYMAVGSEYLLVPAIIVIIEFGIIEKLGGKQHGKR